MRRLKHSILSHLPVVIAVAALAALVLASMADFVWGP